MSLDKYIVELYNENIKLRNFLMEITEAAPMTTNGQKLQNVQMGLNPDGSKKTPKIEPAIVQSRAANQQAIMNNINTANRNAIRPSTDPEVEAYKQQQKQQMAAYTVGPKAPTPEEMSAQAQPASQPQGPGFIDTFGRWIDNKFSNQTTDANGQPQQGTNWGNVAKFGLGGVGALGSLYAAHKLNQMRRARQQQPQGILGRVGNFANSFMQGYGG
jgi:hypothetical protein